MRRVVSLHPYLVHVGAGLVFCKHNAIGAVDGSGGGSAAEQAAMGQVDASRQQLVRTPTTTRNLSLIGAALCIDPNPPPILLCAPNGAGKSSLVRELARMFHPRGNHDEQLLEIHVDEETDTKTLVGSYTATDIPGEFEWRPGALTRAVREGKWVLFEDMDKVPAEIQASLQSLFKERLLPLGNGKVECCHPNFRLFGTITTFLDQRGGRGSCKNAVAKRLLHPAYWTKVFVDPLPLHELKEIALASHPTLPPSVVDSALGVFQALDQSGRDDADHSIKKLSVGRHASVRDLLKVLSRIANGVPFERDVRYATESQRTLCLAESVDVFVSACPDRDIRREFIHKIAAPTWGITAELALRYVETRCPPILMHEASTEVGRVQISISESQASLRTQSESFARTDYALRLMESIGVCIRENEPTLLVGETGTGKTTILQQLAQVCGRQLIVQNLSLQTDSTDLLGGYRPLEMQHVARRLYQDFVDLFTGTFSRKQNAEFLGFAATVLKKGQWKKLSQCFRRAAKLGLSKLDERDSASGGLTLREWKRFHESSDRFEQQRLACDSGLAFVFTEGALIDAIRTGKWVLLDEINLASSETLQRLCGLLDDSSGSLTLTERGDAVSIQRHPSFRLFAAMNPATDSGKKDIAMSVRARFTEIYVDELRDPVELRMVAARYISNVLPASDRPPEHTHTIISVVDLYLECRDLAERVLVDGSGQKPRYTLRTLARALTAARNMVLHQKLPLSRALYEGFQLSFEGPLEENSLKALSKVIQKALGKAIDKSQLDHPGRRPGGRGESQGYALIKPFWIPSGPLDLVDWSEQNAANGCSRFVLIPSTTHNLRRLARAIVAGPWPVLLEGPTSAGKTTLVEYIAARCGHHVVRINNHEHTDVQEYTGGFAADSKGSLSFQDGLLVRALRRGHWVILDELNLAPSEVLEALNRLLDDNRELYIPEINETVKPHPNFRLFATQNPSGTYGGRKPLSRAFRNRFVEIQVNDIPSKEMVTILEQRCGCPPSHSRLLVDIMDALRQRRSKSGVFLGKDGFITPRDLLRWAGRGASSKSELAQEGYMLLAERLRTVEEKLRVKEEIERHLKVSIDLDLLYYGDNSESRQVLQRLSSSEIAPEARRFLSAIAPTKSLLRLVTLVRRCIEQKEPVLLVGETGSGKTVTVQLLAQVFGSTLHTINCHQTTETSDLLGGLRPVRGRSTLARKMFGAVRELLRRWPDKAALGTVELPDFLRINAEERENSEPLSLPDDSISKMVVVARTLSASSSQSSDAGGQSSDGRDSKRRRLDEMGTSPGREKTLNLLIEEIEGLFQRYNALFEWADGPLVRAMNQGEMVLLDEMSLADDAVLERLNSVLEPSRTLVLAEKGCGDDSENRVIVADSSFQLFATMNPGGDFGKRELSPALRSRFTEIWVPPVTDHADISLVSDRSLSECTREPPSALVKERMMEYVNWFNDDLCGDPAYPCSELSLSLRDILTWSRFVVAARQANHDLDVWDAYVNGARLMHLDGLGLGTGLAVDDAESVRNRAESFLKSQLEHLHCRAQVCINFSVDVVGERFGAGPFWIATGAQKITGEFFNFEAPTTALNSLRVLRAMQLSKPVLLEGSPGVGKTTLIGALAAASGHNLVRINLSEQTDVADLIGSDLPVPTTDSGSTRATFRWFDGVLLSAIKKGDWVLLDELNLASQSVLEGLNSCLDHRATVYVPELGKTFDCPPSFRVFAAQNPLAQGGGRKGLPKSFLNRFTKVYVDTLAQDDLRLIVKSRFPSQTAVEAMVNFNTGISNAVAEGANFGRLGSPWEFNLRDIFRWCELFGSGKFGRDRTSEDRRRYARDLYLQRFRTAADREEVSSIYKSIFGEDVEETESPSLEVFDSTAQVGDVVLPRRHAGCSNKYDGAGLEPALNLSLLEPLQAVARCLSMKWPCLLVGASLSGKNSLVRTLAEVSNSTVIEISLSPSSDVSELIGCFEQVDSSDHFRDAAESLIRIADEYLLGRRSIVQLDAVCILRSQLKYTLESGQDAGSDVFDDALSLASRLIDDATKSEFDPFVERASVVLKTLQQLKCNRDEGLRDEAHFAWKDGALVRAMTEGHWLHLRNANLCPSSVLDRLNPVMEPGGYLLLAECGADDHATSSNHREVRSHPDFRVFLSMNPAHGEVSRAMRNRCVEISLPVETSNTRRSFLDGLDVLSRAGLRSCLLGSSLLRMQNEGLFTHSEFDGAPRSESSCIQTFGSALSSLLSRGVHGSQALFTVWHILNEESGISALNHSCRDSLSAGMYSVLIPTGARVKAGWAFVPARTKIQWDCRLLTLFLGVADSISNNALPPEVSVFQSATTCLDSKYQMFLPYLRDDARYSSLRDHTVALVLRKAQERWSEIDYFICRTNGSFKRTIRWLLASQSTLVLAQKTSAGESSREVETTSTAELIGLFSRRIPHLLKERVWFDQLQITNEQGDLAKLSILDVSFWLSDGRVDRSLVTCPVTPLLFGFFRGFDRWVDSLTRRLLLDARNGPSKEFVSLLESSLVQRDLLWNLVNDTMFSPEGAGYLCFGEAEFIVQWISLRRCLKALNSFRSAFRSPDTAEEVQRRLQILMESIDMAVFDRVNIESSSLHDRMPTPVVPRNARDWNAMLTIRAISATCCFDCRQRRDATPLALRDLVDERHPLLFFNETLKRELLGALCTIQLASTDEVARSHRLSLKGLVDDAPKVLLSQVGCLKDAFTTNLYSIRLGDPTSTDNTAMHVEELGDVLSRAAILQQTFSRLSQQLLESFSLIQIAPCAELWCERREADLIRAVCYSLSVDLGGGFRDFLYSLRSPSKKFIDTAISRTLWDVADVRPYQTLLWILEKQELDDQSLKKCLRSLLPFMFFSASKRSWINAAGLFHSISMVLEVPVFPDVAELESDTRRPTREVEGRRRGRTFAPGALVFSLVADVFQISQQQGPSRTTFATIENHRARDVQTKNLVEILASFDSIDIPGPRTFDIYVMVSEVLIALEESLPSEKCSEWASYALEPQKLCSVDQYRLRELAGSSSNAVFRGFVDTLFLPLFQCMKDLSSCDSSASKKSYALAKIYAGLLRYHLLLPDSPVDPGQKPLAKITLAERRLSNLGVELAALQLDSGAHVGDFYPQTTVTNQIFDEGLGLLEQVRRQRTMVIERPSGSAPFFELYRDTRELARTHASLDTVLHLVHMINGFRPNDHSMEAILQRGRNWQMTTEAFCNRLLSKFGVFEDVMLPLVSSIGMVKEGIDRLLSDMVSVSRETDEAAFVLKSCSNLPMSNTNAGISRLVTALRRISIDSQDSRDYQLALALGILSQLVMMKKLSGADKGAVSAWYAVLAIVIQDTPEAPTEDDLAGTEEELMEKEFRSQFPDHRSDFHRLLHDDDDDDDGFPKMQENTATASSSSNKAMQSDQLSISDNYREIVCFLHSLFFSGVSASVDDPYRVKMFRLCYDAARHASESMGPTAAVDEDCISSGHVLALSLASSFTQNPQASSTTASLLPGKAIDFHRDPNPREATKAAVPLERLMARIAQLLSAFPGNAILTAVAKVADRVRKFDVLSTSLGKVMTGLEVILKHAQDWEQHASDRVRLGEPLTDIGRLVSSWRKLELQSWPELLRTREERFSSRARKHWLRIHAILRKFSESAAVDTVENQRNLVQSPQWVWKGLARDAKNFTCFLKQGSEEVSDIVKALDTFCLTSPLGEFHTRLAMLRVFATQAAEESRLFGSSAERVHLARSLSSLWHYYEQFSKHLEGKMLDLRRPLETRLQQEVKLAKWDEQTYYAMAESSERNHRKLMRILREYDEVLRTSVSTLLENELCRGIRADSSSKGDPVSTIPSSASIFPMGFSGSVASKEFGIPTQKLGNRPWTDTSLIGISEDAHASKISRYAQKMSSLLARPCSGASDQGFKAANGLCTSILERIEALRSEKTTRPMKERAFVDLFRELKRHGYAASKWSVPCEIRQIGELFSLPCPSSMRFQLDADWSTMQSSELYYRRCLSEVNRLRSEISMLGSEHMTVRQLEMMLGFSEHGLLLLAQQRCVLSSMVSQRWMISEVISAMIARDNWTLSQSKHRQHLLAFKNEYLYSLESMRQLLVLVKSSQHLLVHAEKLAWSRATVETLESFLAGASCRQCDSILVVSERDLDEAERMKEDLIRASDLLQVCSEENRRQKCLPSSAFESCLLQVSQATRSHEILSHTQVEHDAGTSDARLQAFVDSSSQAVRAALLTVQAYTKDNDSGQTDDTEDDRRGGSIWNLHRSAVRNWGSANVAVLCSKLQVLLDTLLSIHESDGIGDEKRRCCVSLTTDIGLLSAKAMELIDMKLSDLLKFHRESAKLQYILLRIFRTLVSKGFCSDKASEGDNGDGAEGNASSMTFDDDKDGTGMGEGEGSRDVTDEIENEEQLLGLKGDQNEGDAGTERRDPEQLNEEEAEKGMEMEGEFEGDMYDMPDKAQDERNSEGGSDEEEVDREMGEDGGPNEEVIDEKLWDASDDDDEGPGKGEEKFEQNSSVKGDGAADEMTTKEDDAPTKVDDEKGQQEDAGSSRDNDVETGSNNGDDDEMINDDLEEKYEDNQGVNVRDDNTRHEDDDNKEMDLDENLSIQETDGEAGGEDNDDHDSQDLVNDEAKEGEQEQQLPENHDPEEPNGDEVDDEAETGADVGTAHGSTEIRDEDTADEDEGPEEDPDKSRVNLPSETQPQPGLGIRDQDGNDAVQDEMNEDGGEEGQGEAEEDQAEGEGAGGLDSNGGNGGNSSDPTKGQSFSDSAEQATERNRLDEVPNPLTNPGDASKFWHRKLSMIQSTAEADDINDSGGDVNNADNEEDETGDFEYAGENQDSTTQALGEVEEKDATSLDTTEKDQEPLTEASCESGKQSEDRDDSRSGKKSTALRKKGELGTHESDAADSMSPVEELPEEEAGSLGEDDEHSEESEAIGLDDNDVDQASRNQITSDMSQLRVEDEGRPEDAVRGRIVEEEQTTGISTAEASDARTRWSIIQSETHNLSRRLCEKLRLVMEPLVASKLRGDYRTGKRINMKRVIGYIASGYRKDKIWLRRTKPAKRNYRVLLAVDDSESMLKSGAGEMALKAMATLAVGMSQLEVGEVGIASFGNEMNLVHPFHQPFTSESGSNVVRNFRFDQQRTRTALCIESALMALEDTAGDHASMQLVFMISDGRIERDSRAAIRRLVREMIEQNILLVLLIVEGSDKKKDSIINMKEVTFEKGKPKIKSFIEDYPFPYYIVLNDMQTLPEVLGDALRQWFEMLARLQSNSP